MEEMAVTDGLFVSGEKTVCDNEEVVWFMSGYKIVYL